MKRMLLDRTSGACQLLTTKQPAQIAQTAFSHYMEYFCFLRCLLDRGQVKPKNLAVFLCKETERDNKNENLHLPRKPESKRKAVVLERA